jgi:hypothetical protein
MKNNLEYFLEAEKIGNYLLNVDVEEREKKIYTSAMQQLNIQFSNYEQNLWENMMDSRWKMACIDAALALKNPTNNVRRKLFTMLAILETSPNYTSYFLSKKYSFFYLFKIFTVGLRAIVRTIFGLILIKNIQNKCN